MIAYNDHKIDKIVNKQNIIIGCVLVIITFSTSLAAITNSSNISIGETSILSNDDFGNGNLLVAQQVVLSQAATIQSLSFYVASPAGRLRLGIYNDAGGKPQTLKAQTAEFTPTLGWNTQNVVTPSQLTAGTYWLAYLPESNNLHFRLAFNGTARWFSYPYGAMPATFSSSPQSGSYHWSFYAALSAGMIQTNTPTPMATDTTNPSPNPTETSTQTQTPTITLTPTPPVTPTPIQTDIPSLSPTITPSPTPTSTSIPTETASGTSTPTGTATPTPMPTETSTQTQTPTVTVTPTPTSTPTPIPTDIPSLSPTITSSPTPTPNPIGNPNWPIKVSSNGRYLIDQNNVPFLIAGDSPHGLFGDLSLADAETYLAGAHANGINAIWVQLLCSPYSSICQGYTTYDGIAPFSWNGSDPNTFNLASPNENYFSRMDAMVNLAAKYNINVFLDPIETGNWLQVLRSNGTSKDYNYGVYLGNRYKNFPNIVWLNGNDFQTWSDPNDDAVVQAVANGIKSVDTNHLQTIELDYYASDSLNDPTWAPIIGLDAAYSYYPTYDQVLRAYHRNAMPVFMVEAYYEFQTYCCGGYSGPHELRTQEYWSLLSGAAGQLYGNANLYPFPSGWQNSGWQTSPGVTQFKIMNDFFNSFPWYNLVPDQNHAVITSGYGTYATSGFGNTSDYLTAARTPDGNLVISYLPTLRTITVDMTELAGSVSARWFDPSNGAYQAAVGSSFDNSGSRQFTPPGKNSSGDEDWILVLETNQANPVPTPSITPTPTEIGTPTSTSIPTETATGTPTPTGTSTPTKTLTPTVTVTPTPTITYSLFPSNTPTPTATGTATPTKTRTQTITSTTTRTITRTPTVTSTATPTFTSTPTTPGSITIGETHILSNDDFGNGNLLVAQQVVLSQAATIQSLSFYVASPAGRLRLGIYDDAGGKPQTLRAQTAEFTPALGWNTQNVVTPTLLTAGTYWLAYLPESSDLHFRLAFNGTALYYSYSFGALPTTFSNSPQTGSYHWSFYATLLVWPPLQSELK